MVASASSQVYNPPPRGPRPPLDRWADGGDPAWADRALRRSSGRRDGRRRFPRVVGVSAEATVVELSPAGLEVLAGEEPPHCSQVLPPSLPNANAEGLLLRRPDARRQALQRETLQRWSRRRGGEDVGDANCTLRLGPGVGHGSRGSRCPLDPSVPTMSGAGCGDSPLSLSGSGLFDALEQERAGAGLGAAERADAPLRSGRAVERGRPGRMGVPWLGRDSMRLMLRRVSSAEAGGLIAENGEADRRHLPNGEGERTPSGLAASSFESRSSRPRASRMRCITLPIVSRAGRKVSCFVVGAHLGGRRSGAKRDVRWSNGADPALLTATDRARVL